MAWTSGPTAGCWCFAIATCGVIGRVGSALGSAGINIASYHQARRSSQSGTAPSDALAAINVDQALTNGVLDKLQALPDVVNVRLANFGD